MVALLSLLQNQGKTKEMRQIERNKEIHRKEFLQNLAIYTGSIVLLPAVSSCKWFAKENILVPQVMSSDWNPITFNRDRGNQGAIPKSYLASINGPDGEKQHIGKHLPYVPNVSLEKIPDGFLPIMWGDPEKGHTRHPNAPADATKNHYEGHWYNWVRMRKAISGGAIELQSTYSNWPSIGESDNGSYVAFGGKKITSEQGKNTIYLAALPSDVKKGDTVRVYAHCKTHGEWVDFLQV